MGKLVHKHWDEAERQGVPFTVEDCRRIRHRHWESVRQNQITLSRSQGGKNGLLVTKDGTKTKRKRKKAKRGTTPQAQDKKKEENANAAVKTDEKQGQKPKESNPQYCFRCASTTHQVRGCDKVGELKCEHHPNNSSHMTEACNVTRSKKGKMSDLGFSIVRRTIRLYYKDKMY